MFGQKRKLFIKHSKEKNFWEAKYVDISCQNAVYSVVKYVKCSIVPDHKY